jgi:hypothetical protein
MTAIKRISWSRPFEGANLMVFAPPESNTTGVNSHNGVHSFLLRVKLGMFQKSLNVSRRLIILHIQPNQSIPRIRPFPSKEMFIQTEESGSRETPKRGKDILIGGPEVFEILTDATKANSFATQRPPLTCGKVFVED